MVEEDEHDGFSSLLIEGKFEECLECCSGYLTAITDVSKSRGLRPSVDFDMQMSNLPRKFKVCLTFLQCIYEVGPERGGAFVNELESFFAQNSPIPFVVARTWIQLKLTLQHFDTAKELLLAYLGALAETASQNERGTFSAEKRTMYAELASLYIVHTLPALHQMSVAQKFLAMHNNSALITAQQRNQIYSALDRLTSGTAKGERAQAEGANRSHATATANANIDNVSNVSSVNNQNRGSTPNSPHRVQGSGEDASNGSNDSTNMNMDMNMANTPTRGGESLANAKGGAAADEGAKIVISVEQAGAAVAALCVVFGVIAKRDSIGRVARNTAAVLGDAIFGSGKA